MNRDIVLDSTLNSIHASDHFGMLTKIKLNHVIQNYPKETLTLIYLNNKILEPLPIISYDSDVGRGCGAKAFFLEHLELNESFDLVLFNSMKGERWYHCVFSIPDFELCQRKIYPYSLDFLVIKNPR